MIVQYCKECGLKRYHFYIYAEDNYCPVCGTWMKLRWEDENLHANDSERNE